MKKAFLLLIAMSLIAAPAAFAVGTLAGTQIKNQATAQYTDGNGNQQVSTSNEVITIVNPLYGLTITPDSTVIQTVTASQSVYFPYRLTNTGNKIDTFNLASPLGTTNSFAPAGVVIYHDVNGNGVADTGDVVISNTGIIAPDMWIDLVLKYDVPAGSAAGTYALVNIEGTSASDSSKTDTNNWSRTNVVQDAVVTASKSATPADLLPLGTITYTISGTNTGNFSTSSRAFPLIDVDGDGTAEGGDGVLIEDPIPTHTTFGSFGTKAPLLLSTFVYGDAGGNWSSDPAGANLTLPYTKVGLYIANGLADGQAYQFVWTAVVDSNAPVGTISNQASVYWADNTPANRTTLTNTTLTQVNATFAVKVGPNAFPEGSATGTYTIAPYTITRSGDASTVASGLAGTTVTFINTVKNNGTDLDIFNITTAWTANPITGSSVTLYKADGLTPLGDANADGIPDVGPLAANGGLANVVVKIYIPGTQVTDAALHTVTVYAASTEDISKIDLTTDTIDGLVTAALDITNNTSSGDTAYGITATPGSSVVFPLTITNNAATGGAFDTYEISQTLPFSSYHAGWTVEFYPDMLPSGDDGLADAGAATISSTPSLAPGESYHFVAVVSVPAGQIPAANVALNFRAHGVNSNLTADQGDWVVVSANNDYSFESSNNGTATPGGTVFYKHVLKNNGTVVQNFGIALDSGYAPRTGWTYMFSTDATNFYPSLTITALPIGAEQEITVKVFVPSTEAINIIENGVIRATNTTVSNYKTNTDTTTIFNGDLRLIKSVVSVNAADLALVNQPGDELVYTVDYKNLGSVGLTFVYIFDVIPTYTGYKVSSATGTKVFSNDNGTTYAYTPVSLGGGAPAGYDYNVTNIRWTIGSIASGGTGLVAFTVRIK